uniref:Cleavage and polyadenylation specificity factor subunit 4 n=1 Tax=Chelydra serpentina TaxID=8475 RepID=A0A8C3T5N4_CHESE
MQELVAGLEKLMFDLERDVEHQRGALLLPFPGMDKSGASVCEFFLRGLLGSSGHGLVCPFRHISGEKTVVCKHWLRGLCKRGDECEFLHEYDMTKMPECYFYSKFGPLCKYKHTRRVMCVNYLAGFCPEGLKCKFMQYRVGCPSVSDREVEELSPSGERGLPLCKASNLMCGILKLGYSLPGSPCRFCSVTMVPSPGQRK